MPNNQKKPSVKSDDFDFISPDSLYYDLSELYSRIALKEQNDTLHGTIVQNKAEIERLKAIIDDLKKQADDKLWLKYQRAEAENATLQDRIDELEELLKGKKIIKAATNKDWDTNMPTVVGAVFNIYFEWIKRSQGFSEEETEEYTKLKRGRSALINNLDWEKILKEGFTEKLLQGLSVSSRAICRSIKNSLAKAMITDEHLNEDLNKYSLIRIRGSNSERKMD